MDIEKMKAESDIDVERLLQVVDKGLNVADSMSTISYMNKGHEYEMLYFKPCKDALEILSQAGTERAIDKITYILLYCIRDGYHYSGIREAAQKAIEKSNSPYAKLSIALISENVIAAKELVSEFPYLRKKIEKLARMEYDSFEDPTGMIHAVRTAKNLIAML